MPKLASRTAAFLAAVSALVSREYCPGRCAGTELQQHAAHERRCVGGGTQELPERGYRSAISNSEVKRARALAEDGAQPLGSVVACDFYNAGALLPLADEEIVELLLGELLPAAEASFRGVRAVDAWVGKYPQAVSWFSPRPSKGGPS